MKIIYMATLVHVRNTTKTKNQTLNMSNAHCVQYNWSYITFISCPIEATDTEDNIIFNWWFALLLKKRQIWFSDAAKACRNLAVRIRSCRWMERKLKLRWHSVITVDEPVRNIFMNTLVTVNSSDLRSRTSKGQASVAYISTGRHFERSKAITVSSDAVRPTLL